jgi:hypothetical protein
MNQGGRKKGFISCSVNGWRLAPIKFYINYYNVQWENATLLFYLIANQEGLRLATAMSEAVGNEYGCI